MLNFKDSGDRPISTGPLSVSDLEGECSGDLVPPKFRTIGPFPHIKPYLLGPFDLRPFSGRTMNLQRIIKQLIN